MFSVFVTFAVTSFENSGYGTSEGVGPFSDSCMHFPIASHSESKMFESISDKLQWRSIVLKRGSRRNIFAEENHDFCFVSVQLEPFKTRVGIEPV